MSRLTSGAPDADVVRAYAVSVAERVVGLGANPDNALSRASYLAFIAPGETYSTQISMGTLSGCGLVVAGIWRAVGVTSSNLYAPYVDGSAIARLMDIATEANAWVPYTTTLAPSPGDMVLLDGSGPDSHVYTVITISKTADGYALTSVDGGQVDSEGYETILQKSRTWANGQDTVQAEGANPQSTRPISGWVDITRLPLLASPPLWGYVQDGPTRTLGFDTTSPLTSTCATALRSAGYRFCVRTLSVTSPGSPSDLTRAEAQTILAADLGLMAVQRAGASSLTSASASSLGSSNGAAAATNATAAGLPIAAGVWLTMDDVPPGTSAATASAYANAWFAAVSAAGFTPGIYVGPSSGFTTPQELEYDLSTAHYWSSSGAVPGVERRGYQMIQAAATTVSGVSVNPDQAVTDAEGGQVMWLVVEPVLPSNPSR